MIRVKPYAVLAQWIMSEKYKGVPIIFHIQYVGMPGYKSNSTHMYLSDAPSTEGNYSLSSQTIGAKSN